MKLPPSSDAPDHADQASVTNSADFIAKVIGHTALLIFPSGSKCECLVLTGNGIRGRRFIRLGQGASVLNPR